MGTQKSTSSGMCICKSGYSGADCSQCNVGHTGTKCDKCEEGFFKSNGICEPCDCKGKNFDGTCDSNGKCNCLFNFDGKNCDQCVKGSHGKRCEHCDEGFHKTNNGCEEGSCYSNGTRTVRKNGACVCKIGFIGSRCDECDVGYTGDNCDHCDTGFYNLGKSCITCGCDPQFSNGTCDESGQCFCTGNRGGKSCDMCKKGFHEPDCKLCKPSYHMDNNGICQGM